MDLGDYDPATIFWAAAALLALLALFAGWADHRRARRRNVDRPGLVPWQPIMLMAMLAAIVCGALAVRV